MSENLKRNEPTGTSEPQNLPVRVPGEHQMVIVDTTWGTVQPLQPFSDVPTVGELEIIDLVAEGALLVDTRVSDSRSRTTLPGATHLPHDQIAERRTELDESRTSILFCNGPQCPQTPDAIGALLEAGYPPAALAYYRGGLHDWVTLGYQVEAV